VETLEIDGSYGEGGGQVLRTAAAFSAILRRPIHVTKIRAGRNPPGLRQQHAIALKILSTIAGGDLRGADVGSTEVTFVPGKVEEASLRFDLGTAASITLVLQELVPAVSISGSSLNVELVGGTDVPWSPTFDYFSTVTTPAFHSIGIQVDTLLKKRGYYPVGGGIVVSHVKPSPGVRPVTFDETGKLGPVHIASVCCRLPRHVAERQAESAFGYLSQRTVTDVVSSVSEGDSLSPGSSIVISRVDTSNFIGADGIGRRGLKAEAVGELAATEFVKTIATGARVDAHLADMIGPLLMLASGPSILRVSEITTHLETSLHIGKQFTGSSFSISPSGASWLLSISPRQQNS
jgi:RNA 3'-phosphate cyclase